MFPRRLTTLIFLSLFLIGCDFEQRPNSVATSQVEQLPALKSTQTATVRPTSSPTTPATQTATSTPTPTQTPSPTPTPTPTTEPLVISGDPVAFTHRAVEATYRTSCGEVDTLDFPMDPPNGDQFGQSGRDFGTFRRRYDKYHAGEDWWRSGGALGVPVHSIGNGLVTFAQPLGWGRDKGVIIIEHVFNDGRKVLSFYGHLDEESFEVFTGQCVERGEQIAKVGRPKTPPHLHFEMRTHAPYETLGGYWALDPRTAGWVWPSMRIWEERTNASPGSAWVRPFEASGTMPLGTLPSGRFGVLESGKFWSIDLETGQQRSFFSTIVEEPRSAVVSGGKLFVTQQDGAGLIFGFNSDNNLSTTVIGEFPAQPRNNKLIARPGPDGGIFVSAGQTLVAISEMGEQLWQAEIGGRLVDHITHQETLYLTTDGSQKAVWMIPSDQEPQKIADLSGKLVVSGESLWLYESNGVYQMGLAGDAEPSFSQVMSLPKGDTKRGDILSLANGAIMLAHVDNDDARLFTFSADGSLTWERSYRELPRGSHKLATINGRPYLVSQGGLTTAGELTVYEIDVANNRLTRLFLGGTRFSQSADNWLAPIGSDEGERDGQSRLLINIGGGPMVMFDPVLAISEMAEAAEKANN